MGLNISFTSEERNEQGKKTLLDRMNRIKHSEIKVTYTVHAGLDLNQSWACLFFDGYFKRLFL